MNFLSHYYFDQHTTDCYHVLGTVLPDLLKNADKSIVIHPEKLPAHPDPAINSLIEGWKKHLEVDRHFHSSDFFATHSHQLKLQLRPVIEGSPVKPFFLGHIALELILDNLLLTTGKVLADDFYDNLQNCNDEHISTFLLLSGMNNPEVFIQFFDDFKQSRYLHTYAQTQKVAYALKRICMRVWNNPFSPQQEAGLTEVINAYRLLLLDEFMQIFDDIQLKLAA